MHKLNMAGLMPMSCRTAAALPSSIPLWQADWTTAARSWCTMGLPLALIARLDRVLRCAARLIGRIPKYASVSAYMRDTQYWLPISQRISYRMAVLGW